MPRFETRFERPQNEVFEGLHVKPDVLDREWVHGHLKFEKNTKRYKHVNAHLRICDICTAQVIKIEEKDRRDDWKLRQSGDD